MVNYLPVRTLADNSHCFRCCLCEYYSTLTQVPVPEQQKNCQVLNLISSVVDLRSLNERWMLFLINQERKRRHHYASTDCSHLLVLHKNTVSPLVVVGMEMEHIIIIARFT
jgi:hypothetical protein